MAFTFNNQTAASLGLGATAIRRSVLPEVKRQFQEVAGMAGSYHMGATVAERIIEIDIYFTGSSLADAATDTHTLAAALYSNTPMTLAFDDEPDVVYYAILDGTTELDVIGTFRRGTLRFVCSDPYAYNETPTVTELTAGSDGYSQTTVTNGGGVETFPVVNVTLDAASTFLEVGCAETGEFVRVGIPYAGEGTPAPNNTQILNDVFTGASVDWTYTTHTPTGVSQGYPDMEIEALGTAWAAVEYGDQTTGWHGPSLYKALPGGALADFDVTWEFYLENTTPAGAMGMMEFYLLDDANNIMARVGLNDAWTSLAQVGLNVTLGDPRATHTTIESKLPSPPTGWNDMLTGYVRLQRLTLNSGAAIWWWFIGKWAPGIGWRWRDSGHYIDVDGTYNGDVYNVAFSMKANGTYPIANRMEMYKVAVLDISGEGGGDSETTQIFAADDEITADMRQGVVLVNGTVESPMLSVNKEPLPWSALIHYDSSFFALPTGDSTIVVAADEGVGITGDVTLNERWL